LTSPAGIEGNYPETFNKAVNLINQFLALTIKNKTPQQNYKEIVKLAK